MNRFAWVNPASIEGALAELGAGGAIKAGGVDLMDLMKERLIAPERLINLRAVPGLDRVEERADGLHVGPLVTLARLAEDASVRRRLLPMRMFRSRFRSTRRDGWRRSNSSRRSS